MLYHNYSICQVKINSIIFLSFFQILKFRKFWSRLLRSLKIWVFNAIFLSPWNPYLLVLLWLLIFYSKHFSTKKFSHRPLWLTPMLPKNPPTSPPLSPNFSFSFLGLVDFQKSTLLPKNKIVIIKSPIEISFKSISSNHFDL